MMAFAFLGHCYTLWSLAVLEMAKHLLVHGSGKLIPCLVLIACVALVFPVKISLSQPMSFPTFALLNLSPIPPGENEQVIVLG